MTGPGLGAWPAVGTGTRVRPFGRLGVSRGAALSDAAASRHVVDINDGIATDEGRGRVLLAALVNSTIMASR